MCFSLQTRDYYRTNDSPAIFQDLFFVLRDGNIFTRELQQLLSTHFQVLGTAVRVCTKTGLERQEEEEEEESRVLHPETGFKDCLHSLLAVLLLKGENLLSVSLCPNERVDGEKLGKNYLFLQKLPAVMLHQSGSRGGESLRHVITGMACSSDVRGF